MGHVASNDEKSPPLASNLQPHKNAADALSLFLFVGEESSSHRKLSPSAIASAVVVVLLCAAVCSLEVFVRPGSAGLGATAMRRWTGD